MKVKIKKEGKQKTYKLINSWADVTLEKWIQVIESKARGKAKEAEETIAALSDIPKKIVKELSLKDVAIIMGKITELQTKQETILNKVIEINGVEYGMHPDLNSLTLGEYADIETMIKNGTEQNMPEIMAILFRPITERNGQAYTIEAYDGEISIRAEEMKKMSAEQVQAALFFFFNLGKELLEILPLYLMGVLNKMGEDLQMKVSQTNGDGLE